MGFFDRFASRKPNASDRSPAGTPHPSTPPPPAPAAPGSLREPDDSTPASVSSNPAVAAALRQAREQLDLRQLPAALAIYEQVLATAGDRADVLVTISGDLGTTGYVENIPELIAPRYDADRHGPATGLNLLQAYLATRNTTAARHLLDILFALNRAELTERLYGFSNALAELIEAENQGQLPPPQARPPGSGPASDPASAGGPTTIALVSISKPIWFYGLEPLADRILPPKQARLRRVAFAQLALLGQNDAFIRMKQPEDDLGRFSRALPLWLAETFFFSPHYAPIAAVGHVSEARHYALFPTEWSTQNLSQLVETSNDGLDYIFTGALRHVAGDTELLLRVWEVKKFRERKQFTARWSPGTADAELLKLHEQIRLFMEWSSYGEGPGLAYRPPVAPRAWLETLGASLTLFLGEKNLLAPEQLTTLATPLKTIAEQAASGADSAALAWLTAKSRAEKLRILPPGLNHAALPPSPLVAAAQSALQTPGA